MNSLWIHIIHQAIFGGIASAGFGVLFNCPPRIIVYCIGSGAMALAIRTGCPIGAWTIADAVGLIISDAIACLLCLGGQGQL
jgi:uncharacterized membrane protein YjjB (DUF3815 family)